MIGRLQSYKPHSITQKPIWKFVEQFRQIKTRMRLILMRDQYKRLVLRGAGVGAHVASSHLRIRRKLIFYCVHYFE